MIRLYTAQPKSICNTINQGETHYAKRHYIEEKYGHEIASIFTNAYSWFTKHAEQIIKKPQEAESPIWTFHDPKYIEMHPDYLILELEVPLTQAVFFSMDDWNQIINQRYLGVSKEDYSNFAKKLEQQGISYEGDLFTKPFYPLLKQEVIKSWVQLFRFHDPISKALTQGKVPPINDIQAAIWSIPKAWLVNKNEINPFIS